jgi:hypothetical protein
MSQADSINTTSRRGFLARGAAAVAGGATILATPAIAEPFAATATADPAFALIDAKLLADIAHGEAIDAQDEAETGSGIGSDAAWEASERCGDACQAVNEADWRLATTPPTTLAGVAAVLRFANEIEDAGNEWPGTDAIGPDGWHYQLRATMAAALETLLKGQDLGGAA